MRDFFGRSAPYATWLAPIVAAGAVICCYPFLHWVSWLGDEGIWLDGADRLLRGDRLYADFFELQPPLGFWIVETWFRLFGPSILAARWLAVATVAVIASFTYLTCLETSDDIPISLGLSAGWVIWLMLEFPLEVNHHLFTTLFSVISGWAALRYLRRPSMVLVWVAGLSAGCAAMVTQTRGALVMLATLTAMPGKRPAMVVIARYVAGCIAVPVLVLLYLVITGRVADAFRDVILFPALHYSDIQSVPFGVGRVEPLRYFYPAVGALLALLAVQNFRRMARDRVMWTTLALAVAGLLGAFPRPDQFHISLSLPLAIPLAGYEVRCLTRYLPRLLARSATCAIAVLLLLPSARPYYWSAAKILKVPLTDTPRGQVAISDPSETELIKTLSHHADQRAFLYPYIPLLIFLMNMRQTSDQDIFVPYYTAGYQYREACRAVVEQASVVVIDRLWANGSFFREVFPAMPRTPDPNKVRFETALHSAFQPVWRNVRFTIKARDPSGGHRIGC